MASIECDRCPTEVAVLTIDEFDAIVDAMPETEVEPGRLLLRCTAWPASVRARTLRLEDDPVPLSVIDAGLGGW